MTTETSVLVVEDERDLAELYARWLDEEYATTTAYTASEALEAVDESVDVVLLDRRLPDRSGDEVLAEIRERGLGARVAMVTAVEPDFDIIEMGFDDYLTKPVSADDLRATVDTLLERRMYDDRVAELVSLLSKRTALEAGKDPRSLEESEEFADLEARIRALQRELDEQVRGFDDDDFRALMANLDGGSPGASGALGGNG